MRTPILSILASAVTLSSMLLLAGCGGVGSSSSLGTTVTGGSAQAQNFGPFTTRLVGTAQTPVIAGGSGTVITGVAGAAVSSLTLNNPVLTADNTVLLSSQTKIAFMRNGSLMTMNADGSNLVSLTNVSQGNGYQTSVTWSPDGTQIAFVFYTASLGIGQLYVINADGTNMHAISDTQNYVLDAAWSPDGTKIAFTSHVAGTFRIVTVFPDGSHRTELTDGSAISQHPSWSPDGTQIAFSRFVGGTPSQIFVMNADGTNQHNPAAADAVLTNLALLHPAWSPDGTKIAFDSYSGHFQIGSFRLDSPHLAQQTDNNVSPYDSRFAQWSPDSRNLVFARDLGNGQKQICTIAPNSSSSPIVSLTSGNYDDAPAWQPYVKTRNLIGSGGILGSTASGFLYGQSGDSITSVLTFNTVTPANARVSVLNGTTGSNTNYVLSITATDSINALAYTNDFGGVPTTVINNASTSNAALVSYNASTGKVSSVLPYSASRAAGAANAGIAKSTIANVLTVQANFSGIWDETGRNTAPHGAHTVRIDSVSGKVISFD